MNFGRNFKSGTAVKLIGEHLPFSPFAGFRIFFCLSVSKFSLKFRPVFYCRTEDGPSEAAQGSMNKIFRHWNASGTSVDRHGALASPLRYTSVSLKSV